MNIARLTHSLERIENISAKVRELLPELRDLPLDNAARSYQGVDGLVLSDLSLDDWRCVRRHFGKRIKPSKRYKTDDGKCWFCYRYNDIEVLLVIYR